MARVLLVVDMLEGFLRKEYPLYCSPEAEKIIPFVKPKYRAFEHFIVVCTYIQCTRRVSNFILRFAGRCTGRPHSILFWRGNSLSWRLEAAAESARSQANGSRRV